MEARERDAFVRGSVGGVSGWLRTASSRVIQLSLAAARGGGPAAEEHRLLGYGTLHEVQETGGGSFRVAIGNRWPRQGADLSVEGNPGTVGVRMWRERSGVYS